MCFPISESAIEINITSARMNCPQRNKKLIQLRNVISVKQYSRVPDNACIAYVYEIC